jgi:hypothetical protein
MNRNEAPGHLMTMTLFVKLDTDVKEMWYEYLGWIDVVQNRIEVLAVANQ